MDSYINWYKILQTCTLQICNMFCSTVDLYVRIWLWFSSMSGYVVVSRVCLHTAQCCLHTAQCCLHCFARRGSMSCVKVSLWWQINSNIWPDLSSRFETFVSKQMELNGGGGDLRAIGVVAVKWTECSDHVGLFQLLYWSADRGSAHPNSPFSSAMGNNELLPLHIMKLMRPITI